MKTLPFRYEVMNGKGEPMFIDVRRATPDDLDKVMALQDAIVEALPDKDLYATFTREESLGQLEHDICMIAECDGEVAGYSVMIPNDPDTRRITESTSIMTESSWQRPFPWTSPWWLLSTEAAAYSACSTSCVSEWLQRWERPKP